MGRIFLFATLLYGYGDPGFNGHRPASLDRPLRDFHFAVNSGAATCSAFLLRSTTVCHSFVLGNDLRRVGEALVPARD